MPEVKNYDGKKKTVNTNKEKRRPHSEPVVETQAEFENLHTETVADQTVHATEQIHEEGVNVDSVEVASTDEFNTEAQNDGVTHENTKEHLEFYGSDLIRQKAPKVMEVAESVVDEWKKDGEFKDIPVGHPLAQLAASKVLRKAKDVEKKLEEKGVFAMAKIGIDYAKSEIEKRRKHQ